MIQLNLLPDVKLEYIKTRRTKRLVMLAAVIVTGVSVSIMVLLFIATSVLQRQHINNLSTDIEEKSQTLEDQEDLNRILTVQNQLNVLDELHGSKPAASRLGTFLRQVVPTSVNISKQDIDFEANTMEFEGSASSLGAVNQFIDTLKFTTYTIDDDQSSEAFSNVILANFQRGESQSGEEDPVTYQITLSFEPAIFDNAEDISLDVPDTVSTQSADRPDPNTIFQEDNGGQ